MAKFNLKITHPHQFKLETKSLGTIWCFPPTVGMFTDIEKDLNTSDIDNLSFVRILVKRVGRRADEDTVGDINNTEGKSLTDDDIGNLSNEEIETFAREFLTNGKWLLKNSESSKTVDEKGKIKISVKYPLVDLPKEDSECDSDYLVRVLRLYFDKRAKQSEALRRTLNPFTGIFSKNPFSDITNNLLDERVLLSNQLEKTLGDPDFIRPVRLELPSIPTNPIHETNGLLDSILGHAEKFQSIIPQLVELHKNTADVLLQIQSDFNRAAWKSTIFSVVIISIAAMSFGATAFFSFLDYKMSSSREEQYHRYLANQETLTENLIQQQAKQHELFIGSLEEKIESFIERRDNQIDRFIEHFPITNKDQSDN